MSLWTRRWVLAATKRPRVKFCWSQNKQMPGPLDTTGAIAGMLYGALRGYDGISDKIINMLEFKNEIKKLL